MRSDLFPRNPADVRVTEFFGSVRNVERTGRVVELEEEEEEQQGDLGAAVAGAGLVPPPARRPGLG